MIVLCNGIFDYLTIEALLEFVICVGFLYWAFPGFFTEGFSRVNKMVDVVTNRMFDTFNRFSPRENHQTDSLATLSTLKRFAKDQKYRRQGNRESDQRSRDAQLFDIKENVPDVVFPKQRPLMGLSCQNCTLTSRESLVNKTTSSLALRNILNYELPFSKYNFIQRSFSHLYQVCELKKFDYPQVAQKVLDNERLRHAIEKTATQQFQDSDKDDDEFYKTLLVNNEKRARKLLFDMRSTLSDFLLRFTSWVLYKLLPCFLKSVVVHPGQVEMLKKAGDTNLPLIFLPLHKSHLDYILISFILLNNNVRSPLVAAGDNLRIPFFGSLLRGLGAFFIKRRIDPIMGRKDHVYKAVLHTYMNECLRAGHNIEFFLEGGRTRTGKPCMPKYGVLSVIVDSFMDGTIEDALLVPVSVNYEKLVDGNFVREQLGQPKEMETFGNAISGIWHVLNSNYGMMRIDFNQPFSLRELVKTFNATGKVPQNNRRVLQSNPSTTSLYGTDIVSDEHKTLVESISKHIIFDCAQSTSVMSTNALAFLLLYKFRDGVSMENLVNELDNLRRELDNVRRDIGFTGDSIDVINYAIELFGPGLVRKDKVNGEEIVKPVSTLPNVIELSYYSNILVTHFALESVIAIATLSMDLSSGLVEHQKLIDGVIELCNVLQYEFLFCKPCQSLEEVVLSAIDDLIIRQKIFLVEEESTLTLRSRRIASQFDDEDEEDRQPSRMYTLNKDPEVIAYLKYLREILMPLIEAYATTGYILDKLSIRQLLEDVLIKEIIDEMKMQLSFGSIHHQESVSVDPVKNALKLFQKWDLLECHSEKKLRIYQLKDTSDIADRVKEHCEKVYKFKNCSL